MNLDGARNAQAEVFQDIFGFEAVPTSSSAEKTVPLFVPVPGTPSYRDIAAGRHKKRRDARDLIAIGILPAEGLNRNIDDLKLGIFIQRSDLRQHRLVEDIQRLAKGEAKVIYTGRIVRRSALNTSRCRPILVGASTGHYRASAGTIGCICRHRDGGIGILSNNHILADNNKAKLGDIIIQPGRLDGGRRNDPATRIATLFRFVPIEFEPQSRNLVDCAFAVLLGDIEHDGQTVTDPQDPQTTWTVGKGSEDLLVRDFVQKVGRSSGYTAGRVTAIDVDNLVVAMVLGTGERLARFDGQIAIEGTDHAFSEGGDSGAVVFSRDGSPAGLLFAGSESGGLNGKGVTFANPIRSVLDALNLEIHNTL